jgi:hypothetical protein
MHFADLIVRQLRVVGLVEAEEMVAGPSTLPEHTPKETKRTMKAKAKAKQVRADEEVEEVDEEMVMQRRRIVARLMEKKIEVEMLWKEIEALQAMLEE